MVKGYSTILSILEINLSLEKNALRRYREFSMMVKEEELKDYFIELARAEGGHINGIVNIIRMIKDGGFEVSFICPACGWRINFGKRPDIGEITRCRMCGVSFELTEKEGDFDIRRV
ncbi:MAG: hypothetical protein HZA09_04760 [Nitrospirae bacterium]|nr:hypothetical protein [Nitrospirota bacterium]